MKNLTLRDAGPVIKEYLLITLGLLIYVAAWTTFLVPNHLVGGGVTGISTLIYYATGLPISVSFLAFNVVLIIVGLRTIGWKFGIKTIYGVIMTAIAFQVMPKVIPMDLIQAMALDNGKLISSLLGAAIAGFGVGTVIAQGGSTGGTDILAQIIGKYRNISPGRIMMSCDLVIIGSSFFFSEEPTIGLKLAVVLYGYLIIGLSSYTVDTILSGAKRSIQYFIFSQKYNEIADRISTDLHRGVTVISSQGWYTQSEQKILLVIVRRTESKAIAKLVKEIDKNAFISMGSVTGVFGAGFEVLKT
ncbi:MAG TPA: YitT family protein [Bacteroidales bacterium]|nr:YitT family protein [Bacteroidales bacterium]HPJ54740.1 YitT family protein [Bacteroidales bacterium]HPQ55775.1 YitT family protein [Bacteroidales bacterium]